MEIKDLKPAPYNPRVMKERAKKGLRRSLKEYGDLSGIVFNRTTGNLVTGHHRLEELKNEYGDGLELVTAETGDSYLKTPDDVRFSVRIVNWEIGKEMAANVTANNLGIQGKFSDELQPLLWKIKESLNEKFNQMGLDALVKHGKSRIVEGEVEFSEFIDEANNYIVLTFRSSVDWLSALTHFKLQSKASTRRNGKPWSIGVGRVLDGAKYLEELRNGKS